MQWVSDESRSEAAAPATSAEQGVADSGDALTIQWLHELVACRDAQITALQEAGRHKDEFLAVLSHELRNPLAPLMNSVHLVRTKGTADPDVSSLLTIMDRQLRVLVRLVDDLLDVGRIGSGKLQLDVQVVSLRGILASTCDLARTQLIATGHKVQTEFADGDFLVRGDRVRLHQVFSNLLTNAAKYSDRGSTIRVKLETTDEREVVSVHDEGVGIDPSELEEIFNLYSQVRLHRARAGGGLGIGLSLVRRLVELHQGLVSAESQGAGTGSVFRVQLPRWKGF